MLVLPLSSEILPPIANSTKDLEFRLHIALPEDLQELWQKSNGLRLFEDKTYGQSGLIIWSPQKVLEQQQILRRGSDEFQSGDLIIGEFLGDQSPVLVTGKIAFTIC